MRRLVFSWLLAGSMLFLSGCGFVYFLAPQSADPVCNPSTILSAKLPSSFRSVSNSISKHPGFHGEIRPWDCSRNAVGMVEEFVLYQDHARYEFRVFESEAKAKEWLGIMFPSASGKEGFSRIDAPNGTMLLFRTERERQCGAGLFQPEDTMTSRAELQLQNLYVKVTVSHKSPKSPALEVAMQNLAQWLSGVSKGPK